jgi:hypothetical protein
MQGGWTQISPDHWQAKFPDGEWTMMRDGPDWIALPPNGRSYPFALAAGLFRFSEFSKVQYAVSEASNHLVSTLGKAELAKLRRRVCPAGKLGLKHQFIVTSCGVQFDFRQAEADNVWGVVWEGHGNSGALSAPTPAGLFNQICMIFRPTSTRSWPDGMWARVLEDNRKAMAAAERAARHNKDGTHSISFDLSKVMGTKRVNSDTQRGSMPLGKKLERA